MMLEKLEACPDCGASNQRRHYDLQNCKCGYPQNRFLSLGQWQWLSRAFNEVANLRADDDRHINEWLKRKIANARDAEMIGGAV